jgi:hypothetical protein
MGLPQNLWVRAGLVSGVGRAFFKALQDKKNGEEFRV